MFKLNYFAISGFLTFISSFPLFLFIVLRGKNKVSRYFAGHVFAIAMWGAGAFLCALNIDKELTVFMWRLSYSTGVLLIPVFLLHSVLHMINFQKKKLVMTFVYGQAIIFGMLAWTEVLWGEPIKFIFNEYYTPSAHQPAYAMAWISWELVAGSACGLLVWHYITSLPERKKALYILLAGLILGFFGGTFNFFPAMGWYFYPYGNLLIPIFSVIVAYAILQYKFMDISFVLRKGSIYTILIIVISLMYFMTMRILEPVFDRIFGQGSAIAGTLVAILTGFIYAPMRVKIELFVDSTIFREYHQEIARQNALMQDELVHSEKFKMVSTITRQLIYEIRDPLTTIKTNSILGAKRLENKEFLTKAFATIDRQVERVDDLLQQLLTFSNPSPPEFQKTSIHVVIENILTILEGEFVERKVAVVRNYQTSENELLKIDPAQIRQAVYNIVTNAIEAMDQKGGGTLTIRTRIRDAAQVDSRFNFDNMVESYYELRISDTGIGIPTENLTSIFDPFYSSNQKKAGMGLSITQRIIKDHDGFVFAESKLGEGATFIIELPLPLKQTARSLSSIKAGHK